MMKITRVITSLLSLAVSASAAAEEWQGTGELGYTSTAGNTDSQTLNSKLDFSKKQDKWAHALGFSVIKSSVNNVDSADSLIITEKTDYTIAEKAYVFAGLRYENDKFSGFDSQSSISAGMGSRLIENDVQALDLSAGLGLRRTEAKAATTAENDMVLNLQGKYTHQISEHASFQQDLLLESGNVNTHTESISALKMKIAGNLSSVFSYTIKNNSDVPAGVEKTDTVTTIALGYDF